MKKDCRGHTRVPNWLLRKGSPVSGSRLLVLVYLWSRANRDLECWPSIAKIAADLELGDRTVKRAIVDLADLDLIFRRKDRDPRGQYERTTYRLADLRRGPGVKVASGPGVKTASGPGVTPRGHAQGSQWPSNNSQENRSKENNPPTPPAPRGEVAPLSSRGREVDFDRDVPGWLVLKGYAKRAGVTPGQVAEKIFDGIRPAYLLGYLLEYLRKKPKIRKSVAAWFADKCNRRRAPVGCDYDEAKAILRPYLDRVALPGMIFGDLLPNVEKEKPLAEKKREALEALEGDAQERRLA